MATQPIAPNNDFGNIPQALRERRQWVVYKDKDRGDGHISHVPYKATGWLAEAGTYKYSASCNRAADWVPFDAAVREVRAGRADGISFVLTAAAGFIGVDIDDVRDPETGKIEPWAQKIIEDLNSYTEISPSGKGIRIFGYDDIVPFDPKGPKKRGRVEIYRSEKILTVTGNVYGKRRNMEMIPVQTLQKKLATLDPNPPKPNAASGSSGGSESEKDWKIIGQICEDRPEFTQAQVEEEFERRYPKRYASQNEKHEGHDADGGYIAYSIRRYFERVAPKKSKAKILQMPVPAPADNMPVMAPEAFYGVAGDFVHLVSPETEADPVALLGTFLTAAGVLFGRDAWVTADGARHYPVEFLLTVGESGAQGRKGTAAKRVLPVMWRVDETFKTRTVKGLASGEGLIKRVSATTGPTASDKRFLVLLTEFASMLAVMRREGNTLSTTIRQAWDCDDLQVNTRKDPLDAHDTNISVVAQVTPSELMDNLQETDKANGFANRFLIVAVRRSKLLPFGGDDVDLNDIVKRLYAAVSAAQGRGRMRFDAAAKKLWAAKYEHLTRKRQGMMGALCSRAEAHALRLAFLYALLDSAPEIREQHVKAALAFWDYCEASMDRLFWNASGDPSADKIVRAAANGPITVTTVRNLFGNHCEPDWVRAKLNQMVMDKMLVRTTVEDTYHHKRIDAWRLPA